MSQDACSTSCSYLPLTIFDKDRTGRAVTRAFLLHLVMAFKRSSCSSIREFRPCRGKLKSLIPRPAQPAPAVQWSALLQACRINFHILPKPALQKSVWRCQLYLLVRRARPACLGRSTLLARHPGGQNSGARQRLAGGIPSLPQVLLQLPRQRGEPEFAVGSGPPRRTVEADSLSDPLEGSIRIAPFQANRQARQVEVRARYS